VQIRNLEIINFKALTRFRLEGLQSAIVLAGPNGCGKSCVLDAIRLLKSTYGGYQPNEWHNWFGEFQIEFNQRPGDLLRLFQDSTRDLLISADFSFATTEIAYLRQGAKDLLTAAAWREVVPELAGWRTLATTPLASQYRAHHAEVTQRAAAAESELTAELDQETVRALVHINTTGEISTLPSRLLELAFTSYDPTAIGVLDFHSANRQYNREQVAGVNLDVASVQNQRRQTALYNAANKYAGLKTEMASLYVRRVLAEQAGTHAPDEGGDLVESLKDLFTTFFPGKTFLGPEPTLDGRVDFPVRLEDGSTHDLDDLSSGEKEVLYGYVRLRNSAPRNSVILLDEPELHLNPRLIRGLARFYLDRLVMSGNNQLWLITHSDTILREAVTVDGFQVFHMRRGNRTNPDTNQAAAITTDQELERLVIELVGDLAAYRPGAKVVLFEGGGDVEFDVRMVTRLFPEFDAAVNIVAAGNKQQVTALHETLEEIGAATLGARFYAVRDRDSGPREEQAAHLFTWDVYHIENYLLEPEFVYKAVSELSRSAQSLRDQTAVESALHACAQDTVAKLVNHELYRHVTRLMRSAISIGGDQQQVEVAAALYPSIEGSLNRLAAARTTTLSLDALQTYETELRNRFEDDLTTGAWRSSFRGRDVLKRFVARHVQGTDYEALRDLILARMKEAGFKPSGMGTVLDAILADDFPGSH
jgi:predicted ATPase